MKKALFVDTFDPIHRGDLKIINQAKRVAEKIILAVEEGDACREFFNREERIKLIEEIFSGDEKVIAKILDESWIDFATRHQVTDIVRVVRSVDTEETIKEVVRIEKEKHPWLDFHYFDSKMNADMDARLFITAVEVGDDVSTYLPQEAVSAVKHKLDHEVVL